MAVRGVAAAIGVVFGFTLTWSGMTDPDVIRQGLLVESSYLYVLFASALATGFAGLHIVRRLRLRALVTHEPVSWPRVELQRRHVVGSVVFGAGWAISAACPGPIAAQAGGGLVWSLATLAGVLAGIKLHFLSRREPVPDTAALVPE